MTDSRALAREIFDAAVRGADPQRMVTNAAGSIAAVTPRDGHRWIISVGKAAARMASAAGLETRGHGRFGGGIVVDVTPGAPGPGIEALVGDHPVPGGASLHAAERLDALLRRAQPDDAVLLLLSGGASSLIAAPVPGLTQNDLAALYQLLLGSGLDIRAMNTVRKRFARFGAGRLRIALQGTRLRAAVLSDVIGDDLAVIGSGPCEPDPTTAADVVGLLRDAALWRRIPERARDHLESVRRGVLPETPKPDHPAFATPYVAELRGTSAALRAALGHARRLDIPLAVQAAEPLRGDAERSGEQLARALLAPWVPAGQPGEELACCLWGGETTVRLGEAPGRGGRCQQLALAAARVLETERCGTAVTLLAAGTDGRDGPTDAAGAIVDGTTCARVRAAGRDPERDLAARDSYAALDAADALLRTGPTGTNVADVVVGIVRRRAAQGAPVTFR